MKAGGNFPRVSLALTTVLAPPCGLMALSESSTKTVERAPVERGLADTRSDDRDDRAIFFDSFFDDGPMTVSQSKPVNPVTE